MTMVFSFRLKVSNSDVLHVCIKLVDLVVDETIRLGY